MAKAKEGKVDANIIYNLVKVGSYGKNHGEVFSQNDNKILSVKPLSESQIEALLAKYVD
jgi:hypothetical protein